MPSSGLWLNVTLGACAAVFVLCELVRISRRVSRATGRLLQLVGFGFALVGAALAVWAVLA